MSVKEGIAGVVEVGVVGRIIGEMVSGKVVALRIWWMWVRGCGGVLQIVLGSVDCEDKG